MWEESAHWGVGWSQGGREGRTLVWEGVGGRFLEGGVLSPVLRVRVGADVMFGCWRIEGEGDGDGGRAWRGRGGIRGRGWWVVQAGPLENGELQDAVLGGLRVGVWRPGELPKEKMLRENSGEMLTWRAEM